MEKAIKSQELPPLPFTYERTLNPKIASYEEWRISPVSFDGKANLPRADNQIVGMVKEQREMKDWFLTEDWRKKGQPSEQIEFSINDSPITLYNWNNNNSFTEEHIVRTQHVLQELASRFPQIVEKLRWILVEDYQEPSLLGDPDKLPASGQAMLKWKAFRLFPRGMSFEPYRMPPIPHFDWTLAHEFSHLIESVFSSEWSKQFKWEYCWEHPQEWESRASPDGKGKRFFNKNTNEMSPQGRFPLQPEQCVSDYAKQTADEDICESVASYILKPEKLQEVSPRKFEILKEKDAKKDKPEISARRVPKNQIKLPEIKPETVYYFIKEPEN